MGAEQADHEPASGASSAPLAFVEIDPQDDIGPSAYRALYLQSPDSVFFTAPDGRIIAANPAACDMLSMSEEEICRRRRQGLSDPSDERWASLLAERERTGRVRGVARMLRIDGAAIEAEITSQVFIEDGELRTCTVVRDVTERVAWERRLAAMADELREAAALDELTGLRNRRGFVEVASQVLEIADREGLPCHVLFLDVDNMKEINDALGHPAGDTALKTVAAILSQVLRRSDVVARLGGDEFVALTVGSGDQWRSHLERRIRAELASAQTATEVGTEVRVSLGWAAHGPGDLSRLDDLLVKADQAMYEQKKGRR